MSDESTYAAKVFSRGDRLGGAEDESVASPTADEIDVRRLHGNPGTYGQTPEARSGSSRSRASND